ncbi:unnamed protein product [Symbiodinium sp. CCMP2592]|nr:unnamed protein product [Symbiodinium sp. CCMP2592]
MVRANLAVRFFWGGIVALAQVPTELPGLVAFFDVDLDLHQIEGVLSFVKASSEVNIDSYKVYWGSSPTIKLLPFFDLPATGFAPSYNVPTGTAIPSVSGVFATHFLVYSSNSFGESATASSLAFTDRYVPAQGPSGVSFSDTDFKYGEVTGTITIARAPSESDVTNYVLYWGSSPTSYLLYIASLPIATNPLVFPLASAVIPSGGTHILAYTMNADGLNEASIASTFVYDQAIPEHPPTSLTFVDLDLVKGELGGFITVGAATDESIITSYAIYFAVAATGPPGPIIGTATATGSDTAYFLPTDTLTLPGYPYLFVRSRGTDGEMTTGIGVLAVDRYVPVHPAQSISFTDEDLLGGQIAGTIEITSAADETDISKYGIYFADSFQQPLTLIAELLQGPLSPNHTLPAGTAIPSQAQHLLVLSGNDDGYMTTGVAMVLVDLALPVNPPAQLQFDDIDMDGGQIGGSLTVMRASDESDVTAYTAYYGSSAVADASAQILLLGEIAVSSLPLGSTAATFTISTNTAPPGAATHFLAFSKNALGEAPSGISTALVDKTNVFPTVSVGSVSFVDVDVSVNLVGGSITWLAPADTTGLTHYSVVLALDAAGTGRQVVCSSIAIGFSSCVVGLGTSLGSGSFKLTHIIVYTNNGFGEGPGQAALIVDRALPDSLVSAVTFSDTDANVGSVGGAVSWTPPTNPTDASQFTDYTVYFADVAVAPSDSILLGQVAFGTNTLSVPAGQSLANFSFVFVYTKNSAGEALSGSYSAIVDRFLPRFVVRNLFFWDQDLTIDEIGGDLSWLEPDDVSSIDAYRIKIKCVSDQVFVLGQVAVGSTRFQIPFNTPLANCTDLVVVAVNAIGESSVNVTTVIEDNSLSSCPNETSHSFRSSSWRMVAYSEVSHAWRIQSVGFYKDPMCSEQLEAVPFDWPRRPRLLTGAPFSLPPDPRNLHEIFKTGAPRGFSWQDNASQAESLPWWSSGTPCPAYEPNISAEPACAVGFRWESDVLGRGRSMGSTGRVEKSLYAVHCVEIVQSSSLGEYASEIALQWYDSGRNIYRTLLKRQVGGGKITISYQGVLAAECQARLS